MIGEAMEGENDERWRGEVKRNKVDGGAEREREREDGVKPVVKLEVGKRIVQCAEERKAFETDYHNRAS